MIAPTISRATCGIIPVQNAVKPCQSIMLIYLPANQSHSNHKTTSMSLRNNRRNDRSDRPVVNDEVRLVQDPEYAETRISHAP